MKLCGQQDQGSNSSVVHSTTEATALFLYPFLGPSIQEGLLYQMMTLNETNLKHIANNGSISSHIRYLAAKRNVDQNEELIAI